MTSTITVNRTVLDVAARPRVLITRGSGAPLALQWRQAESARVVVTIERLDGSRVRTVTERRAAPGLATVTWNGLNARGRAVRPGSYVVRIAATNRLGTQTVLRSLRVR